LGEKGRGGKIEKGASRLGPINGKDVSKKKNASRKESGDGWWTKEGRPCEKSGNRKGKKTKVV